MSMNGACRICLMEGLNVKNMQPLFEEKDARCAEIVERIQICGGITLKEHETFPKMICIQCLDFLNTSYKFRNMCQASESALLNSIFKSEMKEEPQDSSMNYLISQYPEKTIKSQNDSVTNVDGEVIVHTYANDNANDNDEIYMRLNSDLIEVQEINLYDITQSSQPAIKIDALNEAIQESNEFVAIEEVDIDEVEDEEHLDDSDTDERTVINCDSDDEFLPTPKKKLKIKRLNQTTATTATTTATIKIQKMRKRGRPKINDKNIVNNAITTVKKSSGRGRRKQDSEPETNICEICGNIYSRRSLLNMHMRRHRAEKPFECEICGKTFTCPSEIGRHIRIHTGEKPYICRFCGRTFSDRSTNIKHERIHTNERPFTCQTCGKSFTYSNVLKNHMLTHTGEKPFLCISCNKTFSRKHQLEQHFSTLTHQQTVKNMELSKETQGITTSDQFNIQISDSQPHIVHT